MFPLNSCDSIIRDNMELGSLSIHAKLSKDRSDHCIWNRGCADARYNEDRGIDARYAVVGNLGEVFPASKKEVRPIHRDSAGAWLSQK